MSILSGTMGGPRCRYVHMYKLYLKCRKTFEESYIQVLYHTTFDCLDTYTPHVYLSFDIYYVFNYDT